MSDSTPTAVTVSDRMRALIYNATHAAQNAGLAEGITNLEHVLATEGEVHRATNSLLHEIGWLETVIDQRGKRIQELEAMLVEDARKALAESPTAEREIWCPDGEPCSPDCEHCARLLNHNDPADETPSTNPSDVSTSSGVPPQTRGEAIPEGLAGIQERAAWVADMIQGVGLPHSLYCEMSHNLLVDIPVLCEEYKAERSRLLTALEEKDETILTYMRQHNDMAALIVAKNERIESLQSASVLQKERLAWIMIPGNYCVESSVHGVMGWDAWTTEGAATMSRRDSYDAAIDAAMAPPTSGA